MNSNAITELTYQRLQERAARQGCSVDALLNQLLDAAPEDDLPPALYKRLLDNTSDTISVFDLDLRYRYVNPVLARLLGLEVGDIIGKTDRELGVPPDLVAGLAAVWQQVIDTRQERVTQFDYRTPDGQRYFESRLTPIENDNGDIDYLLSITRDVTEHVHTTDQLRLHSKILNNLHEGVHLARVGDGRILYTTLALEHMFGYEPGEMLGQHVSILNAPTDEDPVTKANQIMQVLYATGVWQGEICNRRKDGTIFWSRGQVTTFNHAEYGPVWVSMHEDITARKQAEAALRESEEKYRLIAENTSDGIFIMDGQTRRMTYVSPAYARMTGRTLEDILKEDVSLIYNLLHPEDRDAVFATIDEALGRRADSLKYTFRARRLDGSYYWREDHAHFNYAPDGTYLSAYVIARDVTERKQAEEALRQSEEKYRLIAENTSDGIAILDSESQMTVYASPGLARMSGWSVDELLSRDVAHIFEWLHPEDRALVAEKIKAAIARHDADVSYIYRSRHADGHYYWREDNARLNYDADGNIINAYVITRDITERKQAEDALRESEAKYRLIAENTSDGIFVMDGATMQITYASPSYARMTGWPIDRILGRDSECIRIQLHPDDQAGIFARINEAIHRRMTSLVYSYRVRHADGHYYWREDHAHFQYDADGRFLNSYVIARDITERKQAEDALRESERRLATLMDNLPGMVYRCANNPDWPMTFVSSGCYELTGYAAEQFTSDNPLHYGRVIHPEDRERVFSTVQAALDQQRTYEIEYRIITAANIEKHVWERGRGIFENGTLQFLEGFITDITERKRAAEALGRSEARLRSIVETQTTFVIRTDMQGNYTYVNGAFFEYYRWRYPRIEDVLGTSSMDTIFPEDQDKARQAVMNCLNDPGTAYQVTLRKPGADGGYFWTLWEFVALTDVTGLEQEIQCVGIDITELMEARHKLHLQENALLAAANAIVITDRDAHIEWVNPAFTHLTGYTLGEALGQNPNALVKSGAHNADFYEAMWSTILGGDVWFGRLINRRKNGTLYTEEQTITPITNEQGEIAHFIAIKQDVTERLRHEAFALENERLKLRVRQEKEQNMRVQQTVSALAHDLRTPLTVISTSKDILTRYSDRISASQRQEKLDAIERQLQFVLELLDDLVMVVKGNLNERSFHPAPVNLPVLCQATIDEVTEAQAAAHEVIFSNLRAVEMVAVDEILVSRILLNLLSNAIKYSPDAGQIRLELDRYTAGVVLRVIDQGMGISAEALPRIFEPFFRAQTKGDIPGSGLGLSIVKDCVDRHHGQIRVESHPGQGTTFIVELPVAESIAAQNEDRQPE